MEVGGAIAPALAPPTTLDVRTALHRGPNHRLSSPALDRGRAFCSPRDASSQVTVGEDASRLDAVRALGHRWASLERDCHAAYGGVFVARSVAWGMVVDRFRPDRFDIAGALVCLVGTALIMFAPGR